MAVACLLGLGIYAERSKVDPELRSALAGLAPAPVPDRSYTLQRIAFGSCVHQSRPQPIWRDILAARPDLMLMLGDNVYGDVRGDDVRELRTAYVMQARHPDFAHARRAVPMLAIWDDHDFGRNDAGAEFPLREDAARLFHQFWNLPPERPVAQGIHYSRIFGQAGRRVQIIFLDTRSFRSALKPKSGAFKSWGKFEPDPDPAKTMLGAAQWSWLERELKQPADVRIIVSSIQALAEGHGWERWANLPAEKDRLLGLLSRTAGGIVLLSGDRHAGAFYRQRIGTRELVDATSSSLNMPPPGPNRDDRVPPLVSDIHTAVNFGMVEIDWAARSIRLTLNGIGGTRLAEQSIGF
jgi:alkaline phosphatase D